VLALELDHLSCASTRFGVLGRAAPLFEDLPRDVSSLPVTPGRHELVTPWRAIATGVTTSCAMIVIDLQ